LPAKTIFASPVFTMEKNGFYHRLAKTCQSCLLLLRFRYFVIAVLSPGVCGDDLLRHQRISKLIPIAVSHLPCLLPSTDYRSSSLPLVNA